MTEFQSFLAGNLAAQNALRAEILDFHKRPREYGRPTLAQLQTDLIALTVEMNVRYMQEKVSA
ncbi:MAG TPA: hypothetical protein VGU23_09715 [Acidobacteriaceae bacterium]|nr:hypothetical protein [Acidobacteriaceae bacterium]